MPAGGREGSGQGSRPGATAKRQWGSRFFGSIAKKSWGPIVLEAAPHARHAETARAPHSPTRRNRRRQAFATTRRAGPPKRPEKREGREEPACRTLCGAAWREAPSSGGRREAPVRVAPEGAAILAAGLSVAARRFPSSPVAWGRASFYVAEISLAEGTGIDCVDNFNLASHQVEPEPIDLASRGRHS